jgi:hypothetical protein
MERMMKEAPITMLALWSAIIDRLRLFCRVTRSRFSVVGRGNSEVSFSGFLVTVLMSVVSFID